jgi:hypothetical protein
MLQIDPQVINDLIDVLVLPISASPFSEDMEPPTLEQLREYFMPIHRAMSEPMPLSRWVPFLPHTDCLQRLCCTVYGPQHIGVSLF